MHENKTAVGGDPASTVPRRGTPGSFFGLVTCTHDTTHLLEVFQTIKEQIFDNWNWTVLFNGGAKPPQELMDDERVNCVVMPQKFSGIGELKHEAFSHSRGEYLVEVDHDDWLAPNALLAIAKAIDANDRPEFLYSDCVEFVEADGSCKLYDEAYGWEHYDYKINGKTFQVNRTPKVSARSLYQIFYAPNHIRVWEAKFYASINGHSKAMPVCDDHDLLCRTYLAGARMVYISIPLYFYRLRKDSKNSYLIHNEEIQTTQQEVGNRYFYDLVHEECRREKRLMLDLGSATGKPPGYIGLDLQDVEGVDRVCDVTDGLPYKDNSIGVIRAVDFLEHIEPRAVVQLMNEIWRVLAPGGFLISSTPSTDGRGAFCDPTHVSFWNQLSFRYYCDPDFMKYIPEFTGQFQATRVWTNFPSEGHKQQNLPYVHADLMKIS